MMWVIYSKHPDPEELLGLIPYMLNEDDPRSAAEQFNASYGQGGGWRPFSGHTMLPNGNLQYPGDPPTLKIAETRLRDEVIRVYEYAWVAVIQPDGSFEVCRMD